MAVPGSFPLLHYRRRYGYRRRGRLGVQEKDSWDQRQRPDPVRADPVAGITSGEPASRRSCFESINAAE